MSGRIGGLDLAGSPYRKERKEFLEHLDLAEAANRSERDEVPTDIFSRAFAFMNAAYNEHVPSPIKEKIRWIKDSSEISWSFVQGGRKGVGIARHVALAAEDSLAKVTAKAFHQLRVFTILALPSQLTDFVKNSYGFTLSALNYEKGSVLLEKALSILSDIGNILDTVGTFIVGLSHFAIIAEKSVAMVAATHMIGISLIFLIASVGIQAKHWYEMVQTKRKLLESLGEQNNFKALFGKIQSMSEKKLAKRIGVSNGEEVKARFQAIWLLSQKNPETHAENLEKATEALKRRIFMKELSHGLKILAGVIGIVGGIVTFTPAAPVGLALLATASILGIGLEIFDFACEEHLLHSLREMAPNDCQELIAYRMNKLLAPHLTSERFLSKKQEVQENKEPVSLKPKVKIDPRERKKIVNWKPKPFNA